MQNLDWVKVISIGSLTICFLLSPMLMGSPDLTEKLMYALFAVIGLPIVASGINILRGK
jgi:hypothetical protein